MKELCPDVKDMFTLVDIGIIHGPSEETFDQLTTIAERLHPNTGCVLMLRDEENRRALVRSTGRNAKDRSRRSRFLLAESLTNRVCDVKHTITDAQKHHWSSRMPEIEEFRMVSFIAAPVHGPAGESVGAMILFGTTPRAVEDTDRECAECLAALVSKHILLKAALATIARLSRDRVTSVELPPRIKH